MEAITSKLGKEATEGARTRTETSSKAITSKFQLCVCGGGFCDLCTVGYTCACERVSIYNLSLIDISLYAYLNSLASVNPASSPPLSINGQKKDDEEEFRYLV